MGLFGKSYDVTEEHTFIIDKYLPKGAKKLKYTNNDLDFLHKYISDLIERLEVIKKENISALERAKKYEYSTTLNIINTQIDCKEIYGIVDVGIVERFTSKTTGNSYENGFLQATIETTFEETWAKSNTQYKSVEKAKNLLIEKTLNIYPEATVIQNFKIDFRELGGSGNVFIYVYGTASNSDKFKPINYSEIINKFEEDIDKVNDSIKDNKQLLNNLPSKKQVLKEIKTYEESKNNH
jgi:hypothetical protein